VRCVHRLTCVQRLTLFQDTAAQTTHGDRSQPLFTRNRMRETVPGIQTLFSKDTRTNKYTQKNAYEGERECDSAWMNWI
jgi:hypothetical protein